MKNLVCHTIRGTSIKFSLRFLQNQQDAVAIAKPLIPSRVLTQNPLIIICLQIFIFLASDEGEQGEWPEPVAEVDDYLSHSADSKPFYPEIENINLDGAKTFVFRPELPEYEDCVDPILSWYSATQRPNFSSRPRRPSIIYWCEFRKRLSGHLRKDSWDRDDPLLDPDGRSFHRLVQPEEGGALIEVRVIKAADRRYVHHVNLSRVSTWKTQND